MQAEVAISIRQPWAALLVAGVKSIEVRTWKTRRRGRVLIHAAKLIDERPEAWRWITTPELKSVATLRGGFIGVGELADCRTYDSAVAFACDTNKHLNAAEWFKQPRLFGFVFRDIRPMKFYSYTGQTLFFGVRGFQLEAWEAGSLDVIDET